MNLLRPRAVLAMALSSLLLLAVASSAEPFSVEWGTSWDLASLQEILDSIYGPGVIDAATDYEGYQVGDADIPYWEDTGLEGFLVREIGGNSHLNTFGWYTESFAYQPIDGIEDGVIFSGLAGNGASEFVEFPNGETRFGFWLNPRGPLGTANAPEPEVFFTNRYLNDLGPDGSGAIRIPTDGDPQCLVYNITHLRAGVPTFVLAWEDLDYGSPLHPTPLSGCTDSDFQDLIIEISAISTVEGESNSWGSVKALYEE